MLPQQVQAAACPIWSTSFVSYICTVLLVLELLRYHPLIWYRLVCVERLAMHLCRLALQTQIRPCRDVLIQAMWTNLVHHVIPTIIDCVSVIQSKKACHRIAAVIIAWAGQRLPLQCMHSGRPSCQSTIQGAA